MMNNRSIFLVLLVVCTLLTGSRPGIAAETSVSIPTGTFTVSMTSLREARFRGVIRQERDFSCGSAAIATLLTYHYGRPTSEKQVFEAMFAAGDQKAIQRSGFSLGDMQRYLSTLGLRSDGFRVNLDKVAAAGVPVITLLNNKGFSHFVVVKGIHGNEVLIGDPILGAKVMSRGEFEAVWQGVMFSIRDDIPLAQSRFNQEQDWPLERRAPFSTVLSRQGLASYSVVLPGLFQF